jgi:hypothetical protein
MSRVFVLLLIVLEICAAAAYGISRDPVRAVYWLSATTLVMK